METEAAVTDAVETVAKNLPLNKTVIIASIAVTAGVVGTVVTLKLKDKVKARIAAMREDAESATI